MMQKTKDCVSGTLIDKRDQLLFKKLKCDYKKIGFDGIKKIEPIINGTSKVSLRIIEWFVTSFSKKQKNFYGQIIKNNDTIDNTNIYRSYKNNLNAYHGRHFSIFKRTKKICVSCNKDCNINIESRYKEKENNEDKIYMNTTIAQLNFFKWILENNLLTHIENNYDKICCELYEKQKTTKNNNNSSNVEDPVEISTSIIGKEYKTGEIEVIINWD